MNNIYFALFSLVMQIYRNQTKVHCKIFFIPQKKQITNPQKQQLQKNFFVNVFKSSQKNIHTQCMLFVSTCFDECFSVITEDIIFYKVYRYSEVFSTTMLLLSYQQIF